MNDNIKIVLWDLALVAGIITLLSINLSLGAGFVAKIFIIQVLIQCVKNHMAYYKLTGKAY